MRNTSYVMNTLYRGNPRRVKTTRAPLTVVVLLDKKLWSTRNWRRYLKKHNYPTLGAV
jgi:hypothetical protein